MTLQNAGADQGRQTTANGESVRNHLVSQQKDSQTIEAKSLLFSGRMTDDNRITYIKITGYDYNENFYSKNRASYC